MNNENQTMLDFLITTVKNAYLTIQNVSKDITIKCEKDYVTNCDLIIEKYIIDEMNNKYPSIKILSEESNSSCEQTDTYFVIDPIDGTVNFASGLDIWGIQVAYIENGVTLIGVIYYPKLNMIIHSVKGLGTHVNGELVKIKEYNDLKNSLIALNTKANTKQYDFCKIINDKIMRVRLFGAPCYGFGMVARGSLDGYCLVGNKPWDIEPGLLMCIESGAKYYRDDFCTIVANSDEVINTILVGLKETILKD